MDQKINKIAADANAELYTVQVTDVYAEKTPHLKHQLLKKIYERLASECYQEALHYSTVPRVLDLGAGEGSATISFLALGARVTAIDISASQLDLLKKRCLIHSNRLEIRLREVNGCLKELKQKQIFFDIIVANSFLHHIPDYLGLISDATDLLLPHGQFFSFQDPMRYDSLGIFTRAFSGLSYFCWRVFQGDLVAGVGRRIRRMRGIYFEQGKEDNAEYHVVRNGVDQDAIVSLFTQLGFDCHVIKYFSTQSGFWQYLGSALNLENLFGVKAQKNNKTSLTR